MTARELGKRFYEKCARDASDLYPGRYDLLFCITCAEVALPINQLKREKRSTIVAHNYLYPEFYELVADKTGDSLGLSLHVRHKRSPRVDFESVAFMGQTAKMILGDRTRVFIPDHPEAIGCSLVFGTDHAWLEDWKARTGGIIVSYINSDPYTKSISEYIGTSSNFDKVIVHAAQDYPDRQILIAPDRFLGYVMKAKAVYAGVPADRIEIYEYFKGHHKASCYVHENIPGDAIDVAMVEHPEADILIHPECGCASTCMMRAEKDPSEHLRFFFLSTEGMVRHAMQSKKQLFIVATEKGMIYRLRRECPEKKFIPVSYDAECRFMKQNALPKLLRSLMEDRIEVVLCNDCCDPKHPFEGDNVIHIPLSVARKAMKGIERMLSIV